MYNIDNGYKSSCLERLNNVKTALKDLFEVFKQDNLTERERERYIRVRP